VSLVHLDRQGVVTAMNVHWIDFRAKTLQSGNASRSREARHKRFDSGWRQTERERLKVVGAIVESTNAAAFAVMSMAKPLINCPTVLQQADSGRDALPE
jgi:hypothetical protein